MSIIFKTFDDKQADVIQPWFDDPETKKYLGDRDWIENIYRLLKEPAGTEFRGEHHVSYYAFVAYDNEEPVGYIDGGIHDRWVRYGGESKNGEPIYLNIEEKLSATITFLVSPNHRNKGYAQAMVIEILKRQEYKDVKIFGAGVEPDNFGSIKTLEATGFESNYKPDFEDMIYFFYKR